ncbi:MAG: Ig-like domain-containing protein [Gemmatimonadales bacterium]
MRLYRSVVLALLVAACGGGDTGTTTPPPPPGPAPVSTVAVTLSTTTVAIGAGATATAVVRDAAGNALTGRVLVWNSSNPSVASISSAGAISALTPGNTAITATVEGVNGSAQFTVSPPPVASVTVAGTTRMKAGDQYQFTATARLADGTVVVRPVTWSVVEPGRGSITAGGLLTPIGSGAMTVRAQVAGITFNGAATSYDWQLVTGQVVAASLLADVAITNKFGQSEYPELVISCGIASGNFLIWVDMQNFVTQSGAVSYSFDGGSIFSQGWIEFDNFSALGYPGFTNLANKNFASLMALSRSFGFAFTEFNASAKATIFRVTGLTPYLNQALAACPSNSIRTDPAAGMQVLARPTPMNPERAARVLRGATISATPALLAPTAPPVDQIRVRMP